MHYITWLAGRKILVGAAAAVALGAVLVAQTFGGPAAPAASDASMAEADPYADPAGAAGEDDLLAANLPPVDVPDMSADAAPAGVVVYVTGAVQRPDVYRLPADARVKDLVVAAGGMAPDADPEAVNLAQRVSDGQHITVPRIGEAPAAEAAQAPGEQAEAGGLVDINTADAAELDALPGIGPALAERILLHREESGPFTAVDGLRDVKGIGSALFEKIAPLVTVGP